MGGSGRGYLAAAVGCVVGGTVLLFVGFLLGIAYVDRFMPNAELEGIVPPLLGSLGGGMVGAGLGTWLALRLRGYARAGWSGLIVAVLTPLAIIASIVFVDEVLEGTFGRGSSQWAGPVLAEAVAAAVAVFARAVMARGGDGGTDPPPSESGT